MTAGIAPGVEGVTLDIGSGEPVTVRALVARLRDLVGPNVEPHFGADADQQLERVGSGLRGFPSTVLVLLLGWLPYSGVMALSQILAVTRRPAAPTVAELVTIGIAVPALLALLRSLGAMGAALDSVVVYVTTFSILLWSPPGVLG